MPFFDEIEKGFCYKQASCNIGLDHALMLETIWGDDDIAYHMLQLSMKAGAMIRSGKKPVPERWDKSYERFKDPDNWWDWDG